MTWQHNSAGRNAHRAGGEAVPAESCRPNASQLHGSALPSPWFSQSSFGLYLFPAHHSYLHIHFPSSVLFLVALVMNPRLSPSIPEHGYKRPFVWDRSLIPQYSTISTSFLSLSHSQLPLRNASKSCLALRQTRSRELVKTPAVSPCCWGGWWDRNSV